MERIHPELLTAVAAEETDQKQQVKRRQSQSNKFKKFAKFFEFWKGHYTRHTFWSCLIRCAIMKWIRWVLLKIQSGHDSVHRWTDGQGDTSILPFKLRWSGGYKKCHPFTLFTTFDSRTYDRHEAYSHFLHDRSWISPWIKSIYNELDIAIHVIASQLSGHYDVISNRLWRHWRNKNWARETPGRYSLHRRFYRHLWNRYVV